MLKHSMSVIIHLYIYCCKSNKKDNFYIGMYECNELSRLDDKYSSSRNSCHLNDFILCIFCTFPRLNICPDRLSEALSLHDFVNLTKPR